MRVAILVAMLIFVAPGVTAQFMGERVSIAVPGGMEVMGPVGAFLRMETVDTQRAPLIDAWFLAGHDTIVNLSVQNSLMESWNGSFRINVTGATATPDVLALEVPPGSVLGVTFAVRAEDMGAVSVRAESIDAFAPGGEPLSAVLEAPALIVPSVRFIDPPPSSQGTEEGFELVDIYGGTRNPWQSYLRVAGGEGVRSRLEVRNDLLVTTPGFRIMLEGAKEVGPVEVGALEPGRSTTIDLPEFVPVEDFGGGRGGYFGPMGRFEMRAVGTFALAGTERRVHLSDYSIENGAVDDLTPASLLVDVQSGLAIELLVPKDPVLGAPTRVKVNLSNEGATVQRGTLIVTLQTPGALFYEVQGPESKSIPLDLAPGERTSDAVEFTPRVTGQWSVQTVFRSGEGFGYGGGGGAFNVDGPVTIRVEQQGVVYARIGEPVRVELTVDTEKPLQDAKLRVTTGQGYYSNDAYAAGGEFRSGLTHRLLGVENPSATLGTLRPGGTINTSLVLVGRSSGSYPVVPYVLAEGFAYTSKPVEFDPNMPYMSYGPYGAGLSLAVQPRPVPAAFALAPLTAALGLFVGVWTLRTRFVK